MSEAETPERHQPDHRVTVEDVRQLMGASTPHFALQLRNRIQRLIDGLPAGDPAPRAGDRVDVQRPLISVHPDVVVDA